MTLPKFALGMLFVVAFVATWSLIDHASWTTIALRAIACALILQVGYFLAVVYMIDRQPSGHSKKSDNMPAKNPTSTSKLPGEQNLSS